MMKHLFVFALGSALFASCNNSGSGETPGQKLDTFLKKADTVTGKVGAAAEKVWDSTKSKVRQLDDKVDNALRKDTTKH
ncbi:hypothetical protein [Flaviaesturariibacter aridisoli]|nr:hypothetical protein [Flaviaesturariibacter aridisoli]